MHSYTEDQLVEQPAIELLKEELGWAYANAYGEWSSGKSELGRETKREVELVDRLRTALGSMNTELPSEAVQAAIEELTRYRAALSLLLRHLNSIHSERRGKRHQVTTIVVRVASHLRRTMTFERSGSGPFDELMACCIPTFVR